MLVTPFPVPCESQASLLGRPKAEGYPLNIPTRQTLIDGSKVSSREFLLELIQEIRKWNQKNLKTNNLFLACMENPQVSEDCQVLLEYVRDQVPVAIDTARELLGTAFPSDDLRPISEYGYGEWAANPQLKSFGSWRAVPFEPASENEALRWRSMVADRVGDANRRWQQAKDRPEARSLGAYLYKEQYLSQLANENFEAYRTMISENPYLAYMSSSRNVQRDFPKALNSLNANIRAEMAELDRLERELKRTTGPRGLPVSERVPEAALKLMQYHNLIPGFLETRPQYCGIASTLEEARKELAFRGQVAMGAGLGALALFAPPLAGLAGASTAVVAGVAVGAGLTVSGSYIARDYRRRNEAIQMTFKAIKREHDRTSNGINTVDTRNRQLQTGIAMIPASVAFEFIPFLSVLKRTRGVR